MMIQDHKYAVLYSLIFTALRTAALSVICVALLLCPFSTPAFAHIAEDDSTAVILAYQGVGDNEADGISVEQFKEHIVELKAGGYAIEPLPKIMNALKNGEKTAPKTIAITFDGAYTSTITNILPLMEENNIPFTVFFSSEMADGGTPGYMTWSQIKSLKKKSLVTLGIFPASYEHMTDQTEAQNAESINAAIGKYQDAFKEAPEFFAYPYGEFSNTIKKQLLTYNFKGVFGQQSGALSSKSDFLALPRFTMTGDYGDLDRFLITANAIPLPVSDVTPADTVITQNPPMIGFTISPDIKNTAGLSCFVSGVGKTEITRLKGGRIEMRPTQPFDDRRTRINCTMPSEDFVAGEPKSWRWLGMMFITPEVKDAADATTDDSPETE